ncbi:UDP-N-acetylmuramoyl-tripeptide--D-alanyl-D-alanine ligase [hydrothermal vent metagenome]|uniref:UDP-MurNAc-pentapeptide synthetase n=1 Tax=hydrothermal vent metagenome TaxID=652676 RepID=A0A3B1B290_9ZZZZ
MIGNHTKFDMRLSEIASSIKSTSNAHELCLQGLSIDSRTTNPGDLFVAITGDNFNGHDFIDNAISKGALAAVTEKNLKLDIPTLTVDDSRQALADIAYHWRKEFSYPLVAITGSNGKTTVKEMISSIFSQQGNVLATLGNLNNEIGVPLTLLQLTSEYKYAVVEMGANHIGEIDVLSKTAVPDVAVITNVAEAHLGGFGSIDNIAEAKSEIFSGLSENGVAVLNANDNYFPYWKQKCGVKNISFGVNNEDADVYALVNKVSLDNIIRIQTPLGSFDVKLQLLGLHNISNALAATAAAISCDIPLYSISKGLEKVQAISGRLEIKSGVYGCRIIDDTYNANPTSLKAAVNVLKGFPGKHFCALGDMGELGSNAVALHGESGELLKKAGIDKLFTIGELASEASKKFGKNALNFAEFDSMSTSIRDEIDCDSTLLIKGSRSMHMEKLVNKLIKN